jgi:hypothetical protein
MDGDDAGSHRIGHHVTVAGAWSRAGAGTDALARSAKRQLVATSLLAGFQLALPVLAVVVSWRSVRLGEASATDLLDALGWQAPAIVVASGVAFAIGVGWASRLGLVPSSIRLRQRPLMADPDALPVLATLDAVALAVGVPTPQLRFIPGAAPNACALGRPGRATVVVTDGVARLPNDEREVLLAYQVVTIAHTALHLAQAGRIALSWAVRSLGLAWGLLAAAFVLSAATGYVDAGAAIVAISAAATVVSAPIGYLVARSTVHLVETSDRMADQEALRITGQPAALASLLLRVAEDGRTTRTRIDAVMWFERAVSDDRLEALLGSAGAHSELLGRAEAALLVDGGGTQQSLQRLAALRDDESPSARAVEVAPPRATQQEHRRHRRHSSR